MPTPDAAQQFIDAAKGCETVSQVARKLNWPMESARHFNEKTGVNLPYTRPTPPKAPTPGVACPKAKKEEPKPKKGGKGE